MNPKENLLKILASVLIAALAVGIVLTVAFSLLVGVVAAVALLAVAGVIVVVAAARSTVRADEPTSDAVTR